MIKLLEFCVADMVTFLGVVIDVCLSDVIELGFMEFLIRSSSAEVVVDCWHIILFRGKRIQKTTFL